MKGPERSQLSVLMACYAGDTPEQLRRSLASVTVDQTRRPDQVVLVVDGPVSSGLDDVIAAAVDTLPAEISIHRLECNQGLSAALTAGLALCRHDIVARQDADDVSRPERFAVQVPLLEAGADLVGSALQEFTDDPDQPSDLGLVRVPPLLHDAIVSGARFHQPFFHPTVIFRRSSVLAVGGYEHLASLEDYWLFARMLQAGARVANVPEALVAYRVGAGAYGRRGGVSLLRSEIELQRQFRRIGFTTTFQFARNVTVRGAYRLVPEGLRRTVYRRFLAQRGHT